MKTSRTFRVFGCNADQPRWLNRLRFVYMIPATLVVLALSVPMLLAVTGWTLLTGFLDLRCSWYDVCYHWRDYGRAMVNLAGVIHGAWNRGT